MRMIENLILSTVFLHRAKKRKLGTSIILVLIIFSTFAGVIPALTLAQPIVEPSSLMHKPEQLSYSFSKNDQDAEEGYQIIQFIGPIKESWKELVTRLGVELFGYLPDFAFLADLNGIPKSTLEAQPFIVNIQPYPPKLKYSHNYFDQFSDSEPIDITITLFHDLENEKEVDPELEDVLFQIKHLGGEITSVAQDRLSVRFNPKQIPKLAELNEVLWLEPVLVFEYLNDVAADIIDVSPVWENLSLNGTGQVVTVCDTGLDNGSYTTLHEDFRGRLIHAYAMGRTGDWSDDNIHDFMGNGVGGHGTHVAGSVLGGGNQSGGQSKGIAYNASLVIQSTMDSNGNFIVPSNLYSQLFSPPYNTYGSRIHTNSWGSPFNPGEYSTEARSVDSFIWDHLDQVILFAAGNSQSQSDVYSPSTAKNCISVGASESLRPTLPGYGSECNNIEQRAYFSCYGTTDNRLKPDILAPGTGILSTRSSMIDDVTNHYWAAYDDYYAYAGGTSMATPITAGVVTLIRQYYTDLEKISPSAALIKATLVNGAVDMDGPGVTPPPIPTYEEGWGRINLENAIFPKLPSNLMYIDNSTGLTTGVNFTYTVEVLNNSMPLNITLVWSDYPAIASATIALVNDLHLNVTHLTSGTSFKGNVFKSGWSSSYDADANSDWDTSLPADGYDNRNNVEGVRIASPEKGRYKITVVGNNIPNGPQPFALALTGGLNPKTLLPPSNVQVEAVPEGNALNITWEPVVGPTAKGYELWRSTLPTSGFNEIYSTNTSNNEEYQDTGLIDGTPYYYKLRTKNIFGNISNFSLTVSGTPQDSLAPWIKIIFPTTGMELNKNVTIKYENDTDCDELVFKYYNDTNLNGIQDDGSNWVIIGIDTSITGTYWWNTTAGSAGPGSQQAVIFGAEARDEVPNIGEALVLNIKVDNDAPGAPVIDTFTPNPVNINTITLTGLTEAKAKVFIYSNDIEVGSNATNYTGKFEVEVELFEGLNAITARAIDLMGNGPGPAASIQDIIVDTVPPVADAGGNFIIEEDTWMVFNGSKSYDTNPVPGYNFISEYIWSFKNQNGSPVILEGQETSYFFNTMGNYTITLSIRDSAQNFDSQKFWVKVLDNTTPIANAGEDFTRDQDESFFLDARASSDNDPKFDSTGKFIWTFFEYNKTKIDQGRIVKVDLVGRNVTYNFSTPGVYNITLTVTDAAGNFDTDNITVTIRDIEPPTAVASSDQILVTLGRIATLSAYKSTDNDPTFPETGNFTWNFQYVDEQITLYGFQAKFRFQKINAFTITLTVKDRSNNTATDIINIQVTPDPYFPTIQWTVPQDEGINVRVTTVIKIKLSELLDIEHTPLNLTTFQLLDSSYKLLAGELFYDPEQSLIRFIPSKILNFGESYTVLLLGSLVDLAGNHLNGDGGEMDDLHNGDLFKMVFTTTNINTTPYNHQQDAPMDTEINATFSGNISEWTLRNINMEVVDTETGEKVSGTYKLDLLNYSVIFKPQTDLMENRNYRVNLTVSFYLMTTGNITTDATDRESSNIPENITGSELDNIVIKIYSWTFKTEKIEDGDGDGAFLGIPTEFLFLILLIIIIIIIIIIITVPMAISRVRGTKRGIAGTDRDLDEDYAEEYREVYGEYPTETKEHEYTRHEAADAMAWERTRTRPGPRHGQRTRPRKTSERIHKAEHIRGSRRGRSRSRGREIAEPEEMDEEEEITMEEEMEWDEEELEDEELEEEGEDWPEDQEPSEEEFDFEEEYITEFSDEEDEFGDEEGEEELEELEETEDEELEELEEMEELEE